MNKDPKRTLKDLQAIHKVYEVYSELLTYYRFRDRRNTLSELLKESFEGLSMAEINRIVSIALMEYDPSMFMLHNAILDYEEKGTEDFKDFSEMLSFTIKQSKKAIENKRIEEIHEQLTMNKQTPDNKTKPEYIKKMIENGKLFPDGERVVKSLDDILCFLSHKMDRPSIQLVRNLFKKKDGTDYSETTVRDAISRAW